MASRQVTINGSPTETVALVRKAVTSSGIGARDFEGTQSGFTCATGASLASWGSHVKVDAIKSSGGSTTINISVKARAQLIDWGKSGGELDSILKALSKLTR